MAQENLIPHIENVVKGIVPQAYARLIHKEKDDSGQIIEIFSNKNGGLHPSLCFQYDSSEKRINHMDGDYNSNNLETRAAILDIVGTVLGCTEVRIDNPINLWKDLDYLYYPDGTYRKNLRPDFN